jgi:NPCBM/NEW2 domain
MASMSDTQMPAHTGASDDYRGVDAPAMYFDTLFLHPIEVGSSPLGMDGNLGYEGMPVMVRGQPYRHALSTHPLAHLMFQLDRCFRHFSCQVALNDDVPADLSHADFNVLASGCQVTVLSYLEAGESPHPLNTDCLGDRRYLQACRFS